MNFIPLSNHFYLVADSYYSTRKMLNGIVKRGCHVITKVKSTAVAYFPVPKRSKKGRGRPKKYGKKVKLIDLFLDETKFTELTCCLYGAKEKVLVRSIDLLSRGFFWNDLKVCSRHSSQPGSNDSFKHPITFFMLQLQLITITIIKLYCFTFCNILFQGIKKF